MSSDIAEWLSGLGLGGYAEKFEQQMITLDVLTELDDGDLINLGVEAMGARKKILAAIRDAQSPRTVASKLQTPREPSASHQGSSAVSERVPSISQHASTPSDKELRLATKLLSHLGLSDCSPEVRFAISGCVLGVRCGPGEFIMGSRDEENENTDDETQHKTELTRAFSMSRYPVIQALYDAVMGENPSLFKGETRPVEDVSWFDAVRFCNTLSLKLGLAPAYRISGGHNPRVEYDVSATGFRLPSEAEWEYACRGGAQSVFCNGNTEDDLAVVGWFDGNSENQTHPVGQKQANDWGLYDMHGNVWEWCWDWHDQYPRNAKDYIGPDDSAKRGMRVIRGGSWSEKACEARSANRRRCAPSYRRDDDVWALLFSDLHLGFRLTRTVK